MQSLDLGRAIRHACKPASFRLHAPSISKIQGRQTISISPLLALRVAYVALMDLLSDDDGCPAVSNAKHEQSSPENIGRRKAWTKAQSYAIRLSDN